MPTPARRDEVTITWNTHVGRGLGAPRRNGRRRPDRFIDLRRNAPHATAWMLQEVPSYELLRDAVGDQLQITPLGGHGRAGAMPYVVTHPDLGAVEDEIVRPVTAGKHPRAVVAQLLRRHDGTKLALVCGHPPPLGRGLLRASRAAVDTQLRYVTVLEDVIGELVDQGYEVRVGVDLNQSLRLLELLQSIRSWRTAASAWDRLAAAGITWAHAAIAPHGDHRGLDDVGTTRQSRIVHRRTVPLFGPHPAVVVRTRRRHLEGARP